MKGSVRKRPNGKFEYYFDAGKVVDEQGNLKRKKISKSGFDTEESARLALKLALEEFENKGKVFKESNMSMSQYMRYYMDNYVRKKCKARTIERYEEVIKKHIDPDLGHHYIKNIDARLIQKFLDIKYNEGYSKKTMESFLAIIKHALNMAVYPYEFIKEVSLDKVKLNYNFKYKKERTLTKDQLTIVLNFLKENNYEYYILFMIAWGSGLRRSELLGLTWDDVDFKNKVIYVRHQQQFLKGGIYNLVEPKSQTSIRDVVIGDTLVTLLKEHKKFTSIKAKNNNFVCINTKGEWMKKHNVANIVKKIKDETGIHIGLHDIRHLHATLLCSENAPIKGVQQRLGHATAEFTLNTYVRTTDKLKKNTADIFERCVL
ncbi:MAG: site-specific integrase [Paeniclostridium sp.]|nr:site-specific integrase [Paeniclostridium sp.]MBW4861758.1 site-specific integrase [Paeniclostridium sp.]MBW4875488.1 site-specific integrase [Paeniclostridium sp.]